MYTNKENKMYLIKKVGLLIFVMNFSMNILFKLISKINYRLESLSLISVNINLIPLF
jgi:hypothetical protein